MNYRRGTWFTALIWRFVEWPASGDVRPWACVASFDGRCCLAFHMIDAVGNRLIPACRRSTAWIRATHSRHAKGLVTWLPAPPPARRLIHAGFGHRLPPVAPVSCFHPTGHALWMTVHPHEAGRGRKVSMRSAYGVPCQPSPHDWREASRGLTNNDHRVTTTAVARIASTRG